MKDPFSVMLVKMHVSVLSLVFSHAEDIRKLTFKSLVFFHTRGGPVLSSFRRDSDFAKLAGLVENGIG